jgi:hypothetical protein
MLHSRRQIIENQAVFKEEISNFLAEEITAIRRELRKIDSSDEQISKSKDNLRAKLNSIKLRPSIDSLFISARNPYPEYYAFWDDNNKVVLKCKYDNLKLQVKYKQK